MHTYTHINDFYTPLPVSNLIIFVGRVEKRRSKNDRNYKIGNTNTYVRLHKNLKILDGSFTNEPETYKFLWIREDFAYRRPAHDAKALLWKRQIKTDGKREKYGQWERRVTKVEPAKKRGPIRRAFGAMHRPQCRKRAFPSRGNAAVSTLRRVFPPAT